MIQNTIRIFKIANVLVIIGTSMQVYPAAGLMYYVPANIPIFYIDPKPALSSKQNLTIIAETATKGVKIMIDILKENQL